MRDPSLYAGQTVQLRADAAELGGQPCEIVDWYERTGAGKTWRQALEEGDPRAQGYAVRRGLGKLPLDDEVLFGRVDGMGQLIHVSEIQGASGATQTSNGPALANQDAVGKPCPGCGKPIKDTDLVAKVPIGPGADVAARARARVGRAGWKCVYVDVHWACRTGDESYEKAGS